MSSEVQPSQWQGEPLPRGLHKLSRETVRASQHERIVRAMIECVGEHGYAATTVPQVVATARVSRNSFYAFFSDKTDCFIAACDELAAEMLTDLISLGSEPDWQTALRLGMDRYLAWWQERPAFSRAYMVELPVAGTRAIEQRDRQFANFAAVFEALAARARNEDPSLPPLDALTPRLIVGGITELIGQEIREGRGDRLDALAPALLAHVTLLLSGGG